MKVKKQSNLKTFQYLYFVLRSESLMNEQIIVRNVRHPFGEDFTRLCLYRAFARHGEIVSLYVSSLYAWITYTTSEAAQAAYLQMNGFSLFGQSISVGMVQPGKKDLLFTSSVTNTLLIENSDTSWLTVVLRRFKNVESVDQFSSAQCLVRVSCPETGKLLKRTLDKMNHPRRGHMEVNYVLGR